MASARQDSKRDRDRNWQSVPRVDQTSMVRQSQNLKNCTFNTVWNCIRVTFVDQIGQTTTLRGVSSRKFLIVMTDQRTKRIPITRNNTNDFYILKSFEGSMGCSCTRLLNCASLLQVSWWQSLLFRCSLLAIRSWSPQTESFRWSRPCLALWVGFQQLHVVGR